MTGAFNHRYFMDQLELGIREADENGHPPSLLMMDIDKSIPNLSSA